MAREPVVAGRFYPGSRNSLQRSVEALVINSATSEDAIAAVSPHAGYEYSGKVAGLVLSAIRPKNTYIILGPNHTGLGEPFAVDQSQAWKTPLGDVGIDKTLRAELIKDCRYLKGDDLAHANEHSIEVQLPFLQVLHKEFTIVPIVVSYADLDAYRQIGKSIASTIKRLKIEKDVTIIASSDMTHYESQEDAGKKDSIAIKAIVELDEAKLIESVLEFDITMCGFAPVAITIAASKALGAKRARLIKYETSGDATGDYSSVVGYAGLVIT